MIAVFLSLFAIFLISFLQTASYGSRMALHRKSDLPYWSNPYTLALESDKLTEEGLRQRKLFLIWLSVSLAGMFAIAVTVVVSKQFFK